jgi:hypothetical protein
MSGWLTRSRPVLIAKTGPVSERLRVREIDDDEGRRLVRITPDAPVMYLKQDLSSHTGDAAWRGGREHEG